MTYSVQILQIQQLTHDVKQFTVKKPAGYSFVPGQATEISIDEDGWKEKKRPFTFTSLPDDENIEFIIKIYSDHKGVTNKLEDLTIGDNLLIDEPWGTIEYKGKGTFLAGGAGITPFISIFRDLEKRNKLKGNKLIFSNKTADDIILEKELHGILKQDIVNVITQTGTEMYVNDQLTYLPGFITQGFLKNVIHDLDQEFYVCGPPPFNEAMIDYLKKMGADPKALTFEQ